MIYLKEFESEEAYNAYMAGNPALPNASVVIDGQGHVTGGTHYTPLTPEPQLQNDEIWYTTYDGKVATPNKPSSLPSIVSNTYENGKGVIKFASDVTSIGQEAFDSRTAFVSFNIPSSVTSIGKHAFYHCDKLSSITIPDSVKTIQMYTFAYCNLTSFTISDNVTRLYESAFQCCEKMTSVTIGKKVRTIEKWVFMGCIKLTNISYNGTIAEWNSVTKTNKWNYNVPATVVHCSDGDVNI